MAPDSTGSGLGIEALSFSPTAPKRQQGGDRDDGRQLPVLHQHLLNNAGAADQ